MIVVGFSGYARSGKDSAANYLSEHHGFVRGAFADYLRKCLYALDPIIQLDIFGEYEGSPVKMTSIYPRLQKIVDENGWDRAKTEIPEVRELLQRMGTEVGRDILGEDVWVDALFRDLRDQPRVAISDVRFKNEAHAIQDRNGLVIRINRPGVGPANDHISETGLDHYKFDAVITNDGSLEDLGAEVEKVVSTHSQWPA